MPNSLTGKLALVTGASRGIGQAILIALAQAGAQVIGTATTDAGAEKITALLAELGLNGEGRVLNVCQPAEITALLADIQPLILVNNAGITQDNLLLRMKEQEWDEVLATNLTAVQRLTKACLRPMLKAQWGRIINISSVSALIGNPGQSNYAAA